VKQKELDTIREIQIYARENKTIKMADLWAYAEENKRKDWLAALRGKGKLAIRTYVADQRRRYWYKPKSFWDKKQDGEDE
jgi:hypothetical protein